MYSAGDLPLVSVVVPCFNSDRFLNRAIDSVLHQTFKNWELLIVDDGSTDRSSDVAKAYSDSRIRILVLPRNFGQSFARNIGVLESKGEWVAMLDADDWYAKDRLETLLGFALEHTADVVADDLYIVKDGEFSVKMTWFRSYGFKPCAGHVMTVLDLVKYEIGIMKVLVRKDSCFVNGFRYDEATRFGEDFLLYYDWLLAGKRFCVLNKPLYYLRRGSTNSLTTNSVRLVECVRVLTIGLLERDDVRSVPGLALALRRRVAHLGRLLDYHLLLVPVRAGLWGKAWAVLLARPETIVSVFRHVLHVVSRRLEGTCFSKR